MINPTDSKQESQYRELIESRHATLRSNAVSVSGFSDLHSLPLQSLLEIPFARKYTVLAGLLISLLAGWAALLVWPRTYVSHAELIFQVGRESVALDPTVTTGQTLLLQKSQEEDINSALQILKSRKVLETVVETLGEDAILAGDLPSSEPPSPQSVFSQIKGQVRALLGACINATGLRDEISNRELALMNLSGSVSLDAPKKSTVITVEAVSKTPQMAQAIAQNVVNAFTDIHRQTMQTRGSREFFVSQTKLANQRLQEAQERRRQFLDARSFVSIEAQRENLKTQMGSIQMDLLSAQRELEQALAKSKKLDSDSRQLDDVATAGEQDNSGTTWGALRQRVYELELQELKESNKYADGHKILEATRRELAGARKILVEFQSTELKDKNTIPNPLKQKLHEEMKLNDSNIAGLRSAIELRATQLNRLETEVGDLLRDENELSQIELDVQQYASSLKLLRDKEEEARVIDELRAGGISSVNQFQPATFVERPIRPNKKLLMAAFAIIGTVSGLGLAFLREINSGAIRSCHQVSQRLDVPVIGELRYQSSLSRRHAIAQRSGSSQEVMQICRSVLSELMVHSEGSPTQVGAMTLGVIGVDAGCGASTIAMALAVTSSEDFQIPTVLVEADRETRTISREFDLNGAPGLSELASGRAEADECLQSAQRLSLRVVSSSSEYALNQHNAASCRDFAAAIGQIQKSADLVIVDLPPAFSPDKLVGLAQHLDHVIVVLESGKTELRSASKLVRALEESPVNLVGVVLNKSKSFLPHPISQILNTHA